jgi:NAD(P)-dependent dehydrogenase (short-subunit alcohol dehydrogenase family)
MKKPVAIITGAANGIGRAISERLAEDGFFAVITDIDGQNGAALAEKLGKEKSVFYSCDIRNEEAIQLLFRDIITGFKRVDVVVNNAGIIRDNMIWNMPSSDFDTVIDVNLKATWMMCREAARIMKEQGSGRIVNIASRAWLGNKGQSNYSASKAGVVGLTRVLALELGKYDVCVNAVAPGLIDTPLTQKLEKNVLQKLIEAQPTRTMGQPEDVANVVSFLVSQRTKFITGQTIYVDGGKSIGAGV